MGGDAVISWLRHQLGALLRRRGAGDAGAGADIYIVSYPRSGNTWTRQILTLLTHPGVDLSERSVADFVPEPHPAPEVVAALPRPRIVKAHDAYRPDFAKAIYIYRDGRDALASWYDMRRKLGTFDASFGEFVSRCLASQEPHGSWQDHVRSWMLIPHATPMIAIRYEALCEAPHSEVRRLCAFLELQRSAAEIEAAVVGSRPEVRQAFLRRHRPELWARGFRGGIRAAPGAWRSCFSPELLELYWSRAGDVMDALGYSREQGWSGGPPPQRT